MNQGRRTRGFSLVEVLVALAVFSAVAAIAWGALATTATTRAALGAQQDRFAAVVRAVSDLERDLRQAISRPVRDSYGAVLPAMLGTADHLEWSRLGFANPRAEPRSNIERVVYAFDAGTLRRGRWAVLDRAPASVPDAQALLDRVTALRLRYLDAEGAWSDRWPPRDARIEALPRAVELRLTLADYGELRRVLLLPSALPVTAMRPAGSGPAPGNDAPADAPPAPPALPPAPGGVR